MLSDVDQLGIFFAKRLLRSSFCYKVLNRYEGIQRKVPDLFTQPVVETRCGKQVSNQIANQINAHSDINTY